MRAVIKRFLSAPVFAGDEEKTVTATMVHYGILFGLVANLITIPMLILAGDSAARIFLLMSLVLPGLLLNHYFLQRGYVRSSSAVLLVVAWALLAGANSTAGGVEAPGFSLHVVFIICVGFHLRGSVGVPRGRVQQRPGGAVHGSGATGAVAAPAGEQHRGPPRHSAVVDFFRRRRNPDDHGEPDAGDHRRREARAARAAGDGAKTRALQLRPGGDGPGADGDPRADERRAAQGGRRPPPRRSRAASGEGLHRAPDGGQPRRDRGGRRRGRRQLRQRDRGAGAAAAAIEDRPPRLRERRVGLRGLLRPAPARQRTALPRRRRFRDARAQRPRRGADPGGDVGAALGQRRPVRRRRGATAQLRGHDRGRHRTPAARAGGFPGPEAGVRRRPRRRHRPRLQQPSHRHHGQHLARPTRRARGGQGRRGSRGSRESLASWPGI